MSTRDTLDVHPAASSELPQVVTALSRAFFEDRIWQWLAPDDAQRRESTLGFYSLFAEACWPHGAVYVAGSGAGAALWLPPVIAPVDEGAGPDFEQALVASAGSSDTASRMVQLLGLLDQHHPSESCWYLPFMGVDPANQRQGIGSALVAVVLARADGEGEPAYLEASSPENRRLYERLGFQTMGELTVSDSPPIYPMWREPLSLSPRWQG